MTLVEVFLQSSDYLEARWSVTALLPLNICKIQNFENEMNRTKLLRVFFFLRIEPELTADWHVYLSFWVYVHPLIRS